MKNKRGFVFAETIIVLTVVSFGLILLYTTFSRVLRREKARSSYNQPVDIYYLNTIKNYLKSLESEFPDQKITPRGYTTGTRYINTGQNSNYFRLECQCSEQINSAVLNKFGFEYCKDNFNHVYANYCSDLNNHLGVREIYIIKNNNEAIPSESNLIKSAVNQIKDDDSNIIEAGDVLIGSKTYNILRYNTSASIVGIARRVNATLIDYLNTLSTLKSNVATDDWSNDYIIIGEFYRDGKYTYASLRYEG